MVSDDSSSTVLLALLVCKVALPRRGAAQGVYDVLSMCWTASVTLWTSRQLTTLK
jgi:hypothetical protein